MASPVPIAESKAMSPTLASGATTLQSSPPTGSASSSSLAASRPRRSSNINNTTTSTSGAAGTRSSSMTRPSQHRSRSRGYSNTSTSPYSPYSSSPSSAPHHQSLEDKRQQTKFERLFGSNGGTSPSLSAHKDLYGTSPSTSSIPLSTPLAPVAPPHSLRSSGIALTRRAAAAAATASSPSSAQRGIGVNYNYTANRNGHADIHVSGDTTTATEDDGDDDDVVGYSSSPGVGTKIGSNTSTSLGNNSLGLGGLHSSSNSSHSKKGSSKGNNGTPAVSSSSGTVKKEENLLRCERCHKVYHHPQSLIKHRWQHTEIWSDASRYGLSKHATVQALEAAVILANPDTLRLLPNDKSHWPAAVSPPTSGLLGSERVNIEVLRKQAEANERELDEQEKAGHLRKGPPTSASSRRATTASSMQMYSKSMPAHVGRRRSGLAFSLHNDMMDDDEDDEDDEDDVDVDIKDDATMATETNDERGDDGDEDDNNNHNNDDDDSTESEDENVIAGTLQKNGAARAPTEMESMDQDMFSLDISSSSPYARPSPLPPVSENGTTPIATSTRSGLSYSRKNYTTSLVAPLAERYTFLPTIPSSSSLHISDNMSNMTAIPNTSMRTRNRSSSHTRSTRGYAEAQDRSTRETSTSSSTDESGVSASASVGAGTTGGSGDEAVSYATKDSGYISVAQDMKSETSQQHHQAPPPAAAHPEHAATPHRPAIDPAQTATISMSAPVLGFFTERSPVSSFSNRGSGAPTTRQQAGHASPRFGPVDRSPVKAEMSSLDGSANGLAHQNGGGATTAQAIPGYTPLEAQAAEILSSSHQSQSGPRSFSQTHFGSSYARSPGYHPYRSPSPFPSSRQLPSSSLQQQQQPSQPSGNVYSSSPSVAGGQAYSFGQAPLGTSYRSTSFNLASPAPAQPKQFPMSPLARPVDAAEGAGDDDEDDMMDMDL